MGRSQKSTAEPGTTAVGRFDGVGVRLTILKNNFQTIPSSCFHLCPRAAQLLKPCLANRMHNGLLYHASHVTLLAQCFKFCHAQPKKATSNNALTKNGVKNWSAISPRARHIVSILMITPVVGGKCRNMSCARSLHVPCSSPITVWCAK